MNDIRQGYFDWLSGIVNLPNHSLLLQYLFNTEFTWSIPFDANRADDGIQLRYRFGRQFDISDPVICHDLDLGVPCSVLEMIVALAIRSEEQIMGDENIGDRTQIWITSMLTSLGLMQFNDAWFHPAQVERIIYIFLNRGYSRTGEGGLFTIPDLDPSLDMRTAEIWYQMCWYMNEQN